MRKDRCRGGLEEFESPYPSAGSAELIDLLSDLEWSRGDISAVPVVVHG